MTHAKFVRISGVESNVAEMRRVIAAATNRLRTSGRKTILFVDEIHHFNKAQQDILLPDVEAGTLRLIGATTYNPFFYVNSALVSRSQVFRLEPLRVEQLERVDRSRIGRQRARPWKLQREDGQGRAPPSGEAQRRRRAQMSKRARDRRVTRHRFCSGGARNRHRDSDAHMSFISRFRSPRKAFSKKPSFTIAPATRTTTRSARSSKACAHQTKKAPCTGSRKCCMPAKISVSSRGAS